MQKNVYGSCSVVFGFMQEKDIWCHIVHESILQMFSLYDGIIFLQMRLLWVNNVCGIVCTCSRKHNLGGYKDSVGWRFSSSVNLYTVYVGNGVRDGLITTFHCFPLFKGPGFAHWPRMGSEKQPAINFSFVKLTTYSFWVQVTEVLLQFGGNFWGCTFVAFRDYTVKCPLIPVIDLWLVSTSPFTLCLRTTAVSVSSVHWEKSNPVISAH